MRREVLTLSHVLCDDVDRLLGHHSVQLHQLLVSQFLHDLGFLEEGLGGHGARLQSLYRNTRRSVPCSWLKVKMRVVSVLADANESIISAERYCSRKRGS